MTTQCRRDGLIPSFRRDATVPVQDGRPSPPPLRLALRLAVAPPARPSEPLRRLDILTKRGARCRHEPDLSTKSDARLHPARP
jgi:hypothetical protein